MAGNDPSATDASVPTYDVFLSYNSQDREAVKQIRTQLQERGIRPWLDVYNLRPGVSWQDTLERVIKAIPVAAVFVGPKGLGPWQIPEQRMILRQFVGRGQQGAIVPIFLPGVEGTPDLPEFLKEFHFIDFRQTDPDPLDQFIFAITGEEPGDRLVVKFNLPRDPLFQLPAALADFEGRADEIAEMETRLRADGGRVGISAVRGMGGVGKTSLAVLVAHKVKDHFPDAQLFVELRATTDPLPPATVMAQVIRAFHPEAGRLPDDPAELLPVYRSVLAGKRALVVLDNAADAEQVRDLLSAPPPVGFLVTSRNLLELDNVAPVRLDSLSPDEALRLLRGLVGDTRGTDAELREIARLCGRLPLALRVAGTFLQHHPNWTLPQYKQALDAERLKPLKGKTKDRDVEAVLALSAAQLVREQPDLAERWQMLAVFPADFAPNAAAAVWEQDDAALATLTALLDRSLVLFDDDTRRYRLHDLLRPVARQAFEYVSGHPSQPDSPERLLAAERRFAMHYEDVLAAANALYKGGNQGVLVGLALYDLETENIRAGMSWARNHQQNERFATELCRNYPDAGVYVLDLRLTARQNIEWLTISVEACRELGDRRGEGNALGNLGNAYADLGQAREAIDYHQQALSTRPGIVRMFSPLPAGERGRG